MRRKITKKIGKIVLWCFLALLILDITIVGSLFIKPVQNFAVRLVTDNLSKKWQSEISIESLYLTPTLKIVIHGFVIKDYQNNDMIRVNYAKGRLTKLNITPLNVKLAHVDAEDATVVVRKYKGDEQVNIAIWAQNFKNKPKKEFALKISKLHVENAQFRYENDDLRIEQNPTEIDYAYFVLSNILFDCTNFTINNDDIAGKINRLALKQYTGFEILNTTGDFRINHNKLLLNNALIVTPNSHIFIDLAFQYNFWDSYSEFLDSVRFNLDIRPSTINTKDIAFFVPAFKGMDNSIVIKGKMKGTINDMEIKKLNLFYANNTFLKGDFVIKNPTEFSNLFFDCKMEQSNFDLAELSTITLPGGESIPIPANLKRMKKMCLEGNFKGKATQFDANLDINSTFAEGTLLLAVDEVNNGINYRANLQFPTIKLGEFLEQTPLLGNVSLKTQIDGKANFADDFAGFVKSMEANLDGEIQKFQTKEYYFKNVVFNGHYADKNYKLNVTSPDTNCHFNMISAVDLSREIPNYNISLSDFRFLGSNWANLFSPIGEQPANSLDIFLQFLQKHTNTELAINSLKLNISASNLDNLSGSIMIDTLHYRQDSNQMTTQSLRFIALNSDEVRKYRLTSDILNASVTTNYLVSSFVDTLQNILHRYLPNIVDLPIINTQHIDSVGNSKNENYFSAQVETFNTKQLLSFFSPSFFVAPTSRVNLYIHSNHDKDSLQILSRFIQINPQVRLHNLKINASEKGEQQLILTTVLDSFNLLTQKTRFSFKKIDLQANIVENLAIYELQWKNPEVISPLPSRLAGNLYFDSLTDISFSIFNNSEICFKNYKWHFNDNNKIRIKKDEIQFDKVVLETDKSSIKLQGVFSQTKNLPITADIMNVDVSMLNSFFNPEMLSFGGEISSEVRFSVENGKKILNGKVLLSDFEFNDTYFGNVFVFANLPTQQDIRFVGGLFLTDTVLKSSNVHDYSYQSFEKEKNKIALINGGYNIKNSEFAVYSNVNSLEVDFLQPFLSSFSNIVKGDASAELAFFAKPDTFYFDGKVIVKDANFGIAPLNTVYRIKNQTIDFNKNGMEFSNVVLKDKFNNSAYLNGTLHHQKFQNFDLNLTVKTDKLLALNTPKTIDMPFFGDGYVKGEISIIGNDKRLKFTGANLTTCKGTNFYLPLYFSESTSESNVIIFKTPQNISIAASEEKKAKDEMELDFDFNFVLTPDALVQIELDPSIGGTLQAKVEGPLRMTYNSTSDLELTGTLVLQSGSFHLTLKDIIDKILSLTPGGTINFVGPIDFATINLQALYKTNASLNEIIPPNVSGDVNLRRTPVNTYVHLKGNLFNPAIDFSFELPNSSNDISTLFYSAIDTTVVENRTRQFFSLLVLGKFESSEQNSSNMVTSAVEHSGMELLTNTINNFISQNLKYVDIGLKYRNADNTHAEEYSISASTSLLDDRMVIEGSFGYSNDKLNRYENENNFIGDYSIEYAISEERNWRLKVFNVTNQYSSFTQSSPYAQGVAVIYKKEFNNKNDFITKKKKKMREQNK